MKGEGLWIPWICSPPKPPAVFSHLEKNTSSDIMIKHWQIYTQIYSHLIFIQKNPNFALPSSTVMLLCIWFHILQSMFIWLYISTGFNVSWMQGTINHITLPSAGGDPEGTGIGELSFCSLIADMWRQKNPFSVCSKHRRRCERP